jgi:hypothetical protein
MNSMVFYTWSNMSATYILGYTLCYIGCNHVACIMQTNILACIADMYFCQVEPGFLVISSCAGTIKGASVHRVNTYSTQRDNN